MKIEIMNIEHIPFVAEIEKEAFGEENAINTLMRELDNKISVYYVATEDGEIKGYIGIWNICGEADIINIAVKKENRKSGTGTLLIEEMKKYCRENKVSVLNLEVRESNHIARAFYEKCGFKKVGERKRYYDGKETAILMSYDVKAD